MASCFLTKQHSSILDDIDGMLEEAMDDIWQFTIWMIFSSYGWDRWYARGSYGWYMTIDYMDDI